MKPITLIAPILLAASLAAASLATAQQSPPPPLPPPHGEHGMHGPDADADGPGRGMPPRGGPQLTEAQQDKLFALHHAAEPARRERDKAMRHAHEALREMADSGKFDEAKAVSLAQIIGQAAAAEALDRARDQAQFLALLTPEQRAGMQKQRERHGPQHSQGTRP